MNTQSTAMSNSSPTEVVRTDTAAFVGHCNCYVFIRQIVGSYCCRALLLYTDNVWLTVY